MTRAARSPCVKCQGKLRPHCDTSKCDLWICDKCKTYGTLDGHLTYPSEVSR